MDENSLIYAKDAKRAIEHADPAFSCVIDNVPVVDAVELVHGRWISDGLGDGERICSVCRRYALYTHRGRYDQYLTDYCPNCGADMRGEKA